MFAADEERDCPEDNHKNRADETQQGFRLFPDTPAAVQANDALLLKRLEVVRAEQAAAGVRTWFPPYKFDKPEMRLTAWQPRPRTEVTDDESAPPVYIRQRQRLLTGGNGR